MKRTRSGFFAVVVGSAGTMRRETVDGLVVGVGIASVSAATTLDKSNRLSNSSPEVIERIPGKLIFNFLVRRAEAYHTDCGSVQLDCNYAHRTYLFEGECPKCGSRRSAAQRREV